MQWTFPYPSQRMPVIARRVVATSQPLAAQAGLDVMRAGGSAADAAIAAAIALTVLEPTSNGLGSDAFALIGHAGAVHGLNASGRSPQNLPDSTFAGLTEMPRLGWPAVTTPGAVSAWRAVSDRFGKLPFERLFEAAIRYARDGYPVAPQTAQGWSRAVEKYAAFEEFKRVFLPRGRAPLPGEVVRLPDHAATLEVIASTRGDDFYKGRLARQIAAHAAQTGGWLTEEDLGAHQAEWVTPLIAPIGGLLLHEIPPNGQGIVALEALRILEQLPIADLQPDCPDLLHLQIESIKAAFADAQAHVADPTVMQIDPHDLLSIAHAKARAAAIRTDAAVDPPAIEPLRGGTVLVVAADDDMMVSFIQSNYEGFGSGIVAPGTGISLQNRGACFTLAEGHPNRVGPGKRPFHTIIPGMVTRREDVHEHPVSAFGVMGGHMQPQGHLQVLSRVALHGQNPQAALDAPRWQFEKGKRVLIEPGFAAETYEELRRRGHDIVIDEARTVKFGGGQMAWRLEEAWCAASDLRRDGQAVGF
jgi:gamma-glutamyltranspeptidase / glutathione hydrolase